MDPLIERMKQNEKVLKGLGDDKLIMLALSEVLDELLGNEVPPGILAKRISLSAELTKRSGIRY